MNLRKLGQQLWRSFRLAFPNIHWFTVSLIATAALSPVLLLSGFRTMPSIKDPLYYLLSAQAETLGSLFVLAFTFTLVAAQIASRYSHIMLHRVIGSWALWFAIPFGVGILLPLFLLRGEFYLWSAQASLLLASYCVFSLLPFAIAVRRLLSISDTMSDMRKEISTADDYGIRDLVGRLGNISLGALNLKDYETFELGVRELLDGASTEVDSGKPRLLVVKEMRRLIMRTVHEQFASEKLGDAIFDLGVRQPIGAPSDTDEEMLSEVAESYKSVNISGLRDYEQRIMLIEKYVEVAIERGERTVVSRLQLILYIIGERVVSEMPFEDEPVQQVMSTLGNIIQRVLDGPRMLSDNVGLARSGILAIEYLGTRGMISHKGDVKDWAMHQLRRVIDNTSELGRQVEGNARASMAVLGG